MKYDMRSSITLQSKSTTQNPIGGTSGGDTFVDLATYRAAYVPTAGRMSVDASEIMTESDGQFWIRYSFSQPLPQQGMYVLFNNNRYYILAANDVGGLHRQIQIICKLEK